MTHFARRIRVVLAAVIAAALLLVAFASLRTSQAATTALEFVPTSVSLTADAPTVAMDIRVTGAQDLGAYEIELSFDPSVVTVERVERVVGTAEQPATGREWVTLPDPATSGSGYTQLAPGVIIFGGYSFGTNNPAGLDGDVTLVRLRLRGASNGSSAIHIDRAEITDTQAAAQPVGGEDATVNVSGVLRRLFLPLLARAWAP
ncbi:MAG: hypothetical protein U0768_01100 [Anaerolineae bacterium]